MAIRNMLHMSQLKAFEEFLESKGYLIIPTVGAYEVLRAQKTKKDRKPKESPVIVYSKKAELRSIYLLWIKTFLFSK